MRGDYNMLRWQPQYVTRAARGAAEWQQGSVVKPHAIRDDVSATRKWRVARATARLVTPWRHVMFRRRALRRRLAAAGAPALPDDLLRRLARALDAGPAGPACVPGPAALRPPVLRAIRFPDLREPAELRRMPHCTDQLCCNPYHFSRLCEPEKGESTQDARRTDHERLATGSLATDGEERQSWETEWCRLAYWELQQRVGRQFSVRVRAVDVFGGGGGTCGSGRHGLCLDALDTKEPQVEQVRKTRAKIGLGVTLSLESDGVWLYNRSQEPVFVSSPALDAAAAKALLVWRVAPGHCLCIFDPATPPPAVSLPHVGPVDPRSVRISFAKGWGPKYSRRDVTACPCWLEVLLAPPS
ncbi:mothers against decapentaplegic homolog 6 isoform X2 [Pieris rapae]|uniref:mothers against decapentaplegic homolog 6 isoform X2 n=1 Tax=Pieris rapae TaxID=64459 RepID=UPI000B92A5D9|nr:mothers against decapentaplegic homolog 6 isoform X2 [Pieris rapae]